MSTTLRSTRAPLPPAPGGQTGPPAPWTNSLPTLQTPVATLRGLVPGDAESLFSLLTTKPVAQFILPPPDSVERFGLFIEWTYRQQALGRHMCFGIVPAGHDHAVGLIQVRRETSESPNAEWGFVMNDRFWGKGIFLACSDLVLSYLFETAGVHRLEARTIAANVRATKALQKLGAVKEGVLRQAFCREGEYYDQELWSILSDEWLVQPTPEPDSMLH